ncbi:MAG: hypothetical protein ABFD69_05140 [Candidatus Sumerlaeia bacterium]
MGLHLPSIQRLLLHFYIDNLVFRHEIGMNWKGKLNRNSPVVQAHFIMLMTFLATAGAEAAFGPEGVMYASEFVLTVAALLGYFIAFAIGYKSIWRERQKATLEQICLSLLSDHEFFEGKFYGGLAPFLEARRYLILHAAVLFGATAWVDGDAVAATFKLVCATMLIVHMNYGCSIGLLAGLRAAQSGNTSMIGAMAAEREYAFLAAEIFALLKAVIDFAKFFLPICLILIFARFTWGATISEKDLWIVAVPFLVFPLRAHERLRDLEAGLRDRLMKKFKAKMAFE